jgi:2-polyprenyl-3-methyl-5-hydroxy-6-metoxy-1,4-benzoquinol methylase
MQPSINHDESSELTNIAEWEKRSKLFGSSPRGVLFKTLPDIFNEYIHNWQLKKILSEIEPGSGEINIIDIGCGYGRISLPILEKFPEAKITGIDISKNYIELFKKNTGAQAFAGSAEDFSLQTDYYDYIICITVLMYVNKENLEKTISNFLTHLKKGGKILLIEPLHSGIYFQTCFGLFNLLSKFKIADTSNTGGHSFQYNFLQSLIRKSGGKIIREYRLPVTTLFFLAIYIFIKIVPSAGRSLFSLISRFDEYLKSARLPSIYIFNVVEKQ